jgi:RimJ/RimL family protein N-acetyltransferase
MSESLNIFSRRLTLSSTKLCGGQSARFSVALRASGEEIGQINLVMKASNEGLSGEIDVTIDSVYDGQGFGIEAMKRLAEYAYEDLGLVKLYAKAPNSNLAAAYSLRRVGFSSLNKLSQDGSYRYYESVSPYFMA